MSSFFGLDPPVEVPERQLLSPLAVAINPNGDVYIPDKGNKRIVAF